MSERFSHEAFVSMDALLYMRFAPVVERLTELYAASTEDEFLPVCEDELEYCIECVKPEVAGARESIERQLKVNREHLDEQYAHQNMLQAVQRAIGMHHGKKAPIYYWFLYFVLMGGAIAMFASTYNLIFPEQNFFLGLAQSIVIASGSYFLTCMYKRSRRKDQFLMYLHRIGLAASIVMFLAAAIARAAAYHLLSSVSVASQDSFLSATGGSSGLETVQLMASGVTFMMAVIAEVTFGGRLMIEITEHSAAKSSIEQLEQELVECAQEIALLESKSCQYRQQLEQIAAFEPLIAPAFKDALLGEMVLTHRAAHEKLRDEAIRKLSARPTRELLTLVS